MSLTLALLASLVMSPAGGAQTQFKGFNQSNAWDSLMKQCAMGPRVPGTAAQLKCRDYLLAETKKYCEDVHTQQFDHIWSKGDKRVTMWNVVGSQNWKDAKVRVVLTTHWDSRPYADQDPNESNRSKPILGANDGASGTAVLLELMRTFKEKAPDVGIMYVLTDGEDLGPGIEEMLLGADYFAKHQPDPKPDYAILIDMIGDKDLRVPMEQNSMGFAPKLMRALYAHAKTVGLDGAFPAENGQDIIDDHFPMNKAGLPTIDLIDFEYAPWHTVQDTADKCSAESLGKVGKLLETWLRKSPAFSMK